MGRPVLGATKVDLSHQEMDRLISELQNIWDTFTQGPDGPTEIEWLPVVGVGAALCEDLGYEDMDEFEDALNGTFSEFLESLPHIVKEARDNGKEYFKILPDPPENEWKPLKMTFKINSTKDLWRVCLKSQYARIEIPELEFEISPDGKRHIDSIYNHIAAAVFNLGTYVSEAKDVLSEDHKNKIMDTVIALNIFLDVPTPWTWIVHDPSGMSEMKPLEDVLIEDEPGEDAPLAEETPEERFACLRVDDTDGQQPPATDVL